MEELKYNIEKKPNCVVELKIEVPWNNVIDELEKVYLDIRKSVRIPGFRKGKVPMNVIKERYNEEAKHELVNTYSPKVLGEVLEKENINPVTTPKIIDYKIEENQFFKIDMEVEVYPDVQAKKYKKLKLEKKVQPIEDKDVEATINNFREKNAALKVKEGAAEDKDYAVIKCKAYMDSKEVKLGLPNETVIEIGGASMMQGFDENIKGMKKDETKEFDYKFPGDFPKEELRGKEVLFKVELKEIKEKDLPDKKSISESLGFDTVEKLNEHIKNNLTEQMEDAAEKNIEEQIIKYLVEKHEFEIPAGLIEEGMARDKKQMGEYLRNQGGDPTMIDESKIKDKVTNEIKAGILLSSIAKQENIEVTQEDRKKEEEKILNLIGKDNAENREKAKKYINENVILTKKVFDFIKENSKIKTSQIKEEEQAAKAGQD